ncbi:hypothetical protein BDW22DRAFT_1342495 [Trametopsis cervina]|nr:hypothetical protein BDW22DRAFT_1342495 [Trametopsis cervina]
MELGQTIDLTVASPTTTHLTVTQVSVIINGTSISNTLSTNPTMEIPELLRELLAGRQGSTVLSVLFGGDTVSTSFDIPPSTPVEPAQVLHASPLEIHAARADSTPEIDSAHPSADGPGTSFTRDDSTTAAAATVGESDVTHECPESSQRSQAMAAALGGNSTCPVLQSSPLKAIDICDELKTTASQSASPSPLQDGPVHPDTLLRSKSEGPFVVIPEEVTPVFERNAYTATSRTKRPATESSNDEDAQAEYKKRRAAFLALKEADWEEAAKKARISRETRLLMQRSPSLAKVLPALSTPRACTEDRFISGALQLQYPLSPRMATPPLIGGDDALSGSPSEHATEVNKVYKPTVAKQARNDLPNNAVGFATSANPLLSRQWLMRDERPEDEEGDDVVEFSGPVPTSMISPTLRATRNKVAPRVLSTRATPSSQPKQGGTVASTAYTSRAINVLGPHNTCSPSNRAANYFVPSSDESLHCGFTAGSSKWEGRDVALPPLKQAVQSLERVMSRIAARVTTPMKTGLDLDSAKEQFCESVSRQDRSVSSRPYSSRARREQSGASKHRNPHSSLALNRTPRRREREEQNLATPSLLLARRMRSPPTMRRRAYPP